MSRCAKIVATIGPASQDPDTIMQLLKAGVNVARLNFSHGTHEEHEVNYKRLRQAARSLNKPLCIMQDLQGPKIRTGELKGGSVILQPDQSLILTTEPIIGDNHRISVDFEDLPRSVQPGGKILLDDGHLELLVVGTRTGEVETRVIIGGMLKPHKGVNLPGAPVDLPCTTEKDLRDLAFGLKLGVDAVALSFVRSASDIIRLKNTIAQFAPEPVNLPIIAKLERPEALENLEEIMEVTDGVMVARGDLGVEMPPEEVPIAQKRIIDCANRYGKIVITATQMLDSMIYNPRPTRAEASDVANAILDGSDAVMLSGETATGKYPVKAVQMMDAIIEQTEQHAAKWGKYQGVDPTKVSNDDTYYMTLAARELAHDRNVAAIAPFTNSGRTALLMSKTRPSVQIMAFTGHQQTYNLMSLYWGVQPFLVPHANTIKAMVLSVEEALTKTTTIEPGQQFILICGFPVDKIRPTNLALLLTVGDPL